MTPPDAAAQASSPSYPWDRPLGARAHADGTTTFRVWSPAASTVVVRVAGVDHPLVDEGHGVRSTEVRAGHGDDYRFVLDGTPRPDPCSRWQPAGIRGPSRVLDPARFVWNDGGWTAPTMDQLVIYELHVGTFSGEGTFDSATLYLAALAEMGVTAVEIMPIAEFPGRRGWGYDGVYLSAAQSSYGGPKALARFVNAAHRVGLAVLLDVVYNHVGASGGGAIAAFGPYFTDTYQTPWGDALNFDGAGCDPVRAWVRQSAVGWVRDFHIDGLRLDAVHAIHDEGPTHVVADVAAAVHAERPDAVVIAESGMNDPRVIRPADVGGWGLDGVWADDFHHALRVLLTGDRSGWYEEFGQVGQLAKAFHRPHVHDGQFSTFRDKRFGASADDRPPTQFVVFDQNHDQVGNRAFGDRLPSEVLPLAALCTLLSPFVPMLFMGEDHGESAPFQFFTDHIDPDIAEATREGRRREFASFAEFAGVEIPDPQDPATFERSKLTRASNPSITALYARVLAARRLLPPGDAEAIDHDDDERWLRVRRGPYELIANFADEERNVPTAATEITVATHGPTTVLSAGHIELPAKAGALVRTIT
ncbi:MAG: malto-oligosyltrehalose trehalohydrolase [Actinomycetota bacterium]|nr:malto-oligosyltrehalose trehalohydrolase [Actinomycetota bacterium]